jgi:hypothetical protein
MRVNARQLHDSVRMMRECRTRAVIARETRALPHAFVRIFITAERSSVVVFH